MHRSVASVVLLASVLVSCGDVKDNGKLADAPSSDDAAVDAPPGPVKATVLTLTGDGAPDATAKLLFQNPDGSVIADSAVDAGGHAEAMMPLGGSVSAIRVSADTAANLTAAIVTITGVKPGDDLTFGLKANPNQLQGGQTTMTANFTPVQGAGSVVFYTACSPDGTAGDAVKGNVTLTFRDSCHGATFDLLGIASGGSLNAPQYLKLTNIAYATGETFTIPNGFLNMGTFTATLTNVPDVVSSLSFTRSSVLGNASVAAQSADLADPAAGTVTATVPFPTATGTRSELVAAMSRPDSQSGQVVSAHTDALAVTGTLDLGALTLPWITTLTSTVTGATWTTVQAGAAPDGMLTQWSGRWTTAAGVATTLAWRVIQPVEAAGMTLPRLPATYARLDPAQQTVTVTPGLLLLLMADYDKINGYDELRQMPETLLVTAPSTLGAFVGQPWQRRIATASTLRRL